MSAFKKVAAELARRVKDSKDDDSLDMTIAAASHALKTLREIAGEMPLQVLTALNLCGAARHITLPKDES